MTTAKRYVGEFHGAHHPTVPRTRPVTLRIRLDHCGSLRGNRGDDMNRRELLVSLISTCVVVAGLAVMLGATDTPAAKTKAKAKDKAKTGAKAKSDETITTTTLGPSPSTYEVHTSGDTPHRPPASPKPTASPK